MTATHNTPTVQRTSGVHCNEPLMIADVHEGNAEQTTNYIDIMVSSGVATHVCAPWFAQEFPIQPLTADKEPHLSQSGLEEQDFEPTVKEEQPTMKHAKGFNTTLVNEHSLYYLKTTVTPILSNHTLQIQHTSEGTIAVIAPTTITTQGPEHCRRKQRVLDVQ